jgi:hypothetical protein
MNENYALIFAVAFGVLACGLLVKNYIDNKIRHLRYLIDSNERYMSDEVMACTRNSNEKIAEVKREFEDSRTHLWREVDSLWEKCHNDNKDCKKSYYNDGTGCCKTGSAAEYLKG